jgi:hypothetical protein
MIRIPFRYSIPLKQRWMAMAFLLGITAPVMVHAGTLTMQESLVELNTAVQDYQMGERPSALQTLLSITSDPEYPQSIQQEARIYIAEILLVEGNTEGARNYFMEVLEIDSNYSIDRFRHPPEVCMEFDFANTQWRQKQPVPTVRRRTSSWSKFAPFGIYQFQNDQQWKGVALSGLQIGTAITSVVLFSYLRQNPGYNQNDPTEQSRLETILTAQRASAIGFYSLWLISTIDAQKDWQMEDKQ